MTPDALLVLSFGGPDGPDDVMPFLRNVTAGRNVPDDRLKVVAEQYRIFGGRSPINDQNRALIEALKNELAGTEMDMPIYFGNRNWHPFVSDTVAQMSNDGVNRALVFTTSAFGSYSGCRQYRENLQAACAEISNAPQLQKLRLFYNHPGFIVAVAERIREVIEPPQRLVFTAHSIPLVMAQSCDYESQLREAARLVADALDYTDEYDIVFQSRSGPPQVPWLEPDICDHLETLSSSVSAVCVVPLGFVSDHTEVLYDLDTQAAAKADELGLRMTRAQTVGTHPKFVTMIADLIAEQTRGTTRLFLGTQGPWPDECPEGHCLAKREGGRPPT